MKYNSCPIPPLRRNWCRHCCLAALLCLSACQKKPVEVSGQVFIVNPDGASVKLGLVGIHVLGDGEFKALATSVLDRLAEADRWVAQRESDNKTFDLCESLCRWRPFQEGVTPGLEDLQNEVRARHLALGPAGSHPNFDDLLDGVIDALPPALTRTDGDGRFSIPVDRKVWVVAVMPRKFGERGEGRLWAVPFVPGGPGKAGPLFLSNNGLVPDIDSFAAIANRPWKAASSHGSAGVTAWVVAAVARAEELAADARRKQSTTFAGSGDAGLSTARGSIR